MYCFIIFICSVVVSVVLSFGVKFLATFLKIQDLPKEPRKMHKRPVPLLGGLAPFLAFFAIAFVLVYLKIIPGALVPSLGWLLYAAALIMLGGFLDDKYSLPPGRQIWFPLSAIAIAVFFGGIRVNLITNPYGGVIYLLPAVSIILSFLWLFVITYTTKILDGLDGLVSGITPIGALTIFLFTTFTNFKEAGLSYIAIILAGVFVGFLFLNFYPAKIFLGEGGSLFAGFMLGSLAIMTGAKIAVTLMVLALPLIDLMAVIIKRLLKKKPIWKGDRLHLHYLLVDRGWKPQNVAFLFWGLSATMGLAAVFLPSGVKIISLFVILVIFFFVDLFLIKENR